MREAVGEKAARYGALSYRFLYETTFIYPNIYK